MSISCIIVRKKAWRCKRWVPTLRMGYINLAGAQHSLGAHHLANSVNGRPIRAPGPPRLNFDRPGWNSLVIDTRPFSDSSALSPSLIDFKIESGVCSVNAGNETFKIVILFFIVFIAHKISWLYYSYSFTHSIRFCGVAFLFFVRYFYSLFILSVSTTQWSAHECSVVRDLWCRIFSWLWFARISQKIIEFHFIYLLRWPFFLLREVHHVRMHLLVYSLTTQYCAYFVLNWFRGLNNTSG